MMMTATESEPDCPEKAKADFSQNTIFVPLTIALLRICQISQRFYRPDTLEPLCQNA